MVVISSWPLNSNDLSSDAGLLLFKAFIHKIGENTLILECFKTDDKTSRIHSDTHNLLQKMYQQFAGYFADNHSDELIRDPIFTSLLDKESLASQSTMSRFFNRMDDISLMQLKWTLYLLRRRIYSIRKPEMILLDIDSTLFQIFGKQEGNDFNYHYSNHGYHPLLCDDGLTGDLRRAMIRPGNVYTSSDCCTFLKLLIDRISRGLFRYHLVFTW